LDACRNNPFASSQRSTNNGLAPLDAPTGTFIAYATAPGRVASDGPGRNGLYTAELLTQMRVRGLNLPALFMRVRAAVIKQTGNKQVPWESSSLLGEFYLLPLVADSSTTNLGAAANRREASSTPEAR
ncbi:MAG TPA: caspase family protein, partial [Pyrinomonadaceae bacterium]|nr:caspase family protein [Pyrinomonadaceae bacterium]